MDGDLTLLHAFTRISHELRMSVEEQRRFWDAIAQTIQDVEAHLIDPDSANPAEISQVFRQLQVPSLRAIGERIVKPGEVVPFVSRKAQRPAVREELVLEHASFILKPQFEAAIIAKRLATAAAELDAAGTRRDVASVRSQAAMVRELATQAFLDPLIPAALTMQQRLSPAGKLLVDATQLAERLRTVAHNVHAVSHVRDLTSSWPGTVEGDEQLMHFRLIRPLRKGGMGTVILAWDQRLERHVVLKRLGSDQEPEQGRLRLIREARAGARLRHTNIVTIHALEYFEEEPILVQEYIEGEDLDNLVGELDVAGALRIALGVAAGMTYAHARGIMHRDLKPSNIRLREDRTPVILDFGLGKAFSTSPDARTEVQLTRPSSVLGTPLYMAPEQWAGQNVTPAADVFSFGVMLFELISGSRLFAGKDAYEINAAVRERRVPPLSREDVPEGVEALIHRCLAVEAEERPRMADVQEQLLVLDARETQPAREQPDVSVLNVGVRSAWSIDKTVRARTLMSADAPRLEAYITFQQAVSPARIEGLEQIVQGLSRVDMRIGRAVNVQRSLSDLSGRLTDAEGMAMWALRATGELVYVVEIPSSSALVIPLEPLLRETIHVLFYAARLAAAIWPDHPDAPFLIEFELHNARQRIVAAANWSPRLAASVARLRQPPGLDAITSGIVVTAQAVRDDLLPVVKLVFDDLMRGFEFVVVPEWQYRQQIAAALGSTSA